MTKITSGVIDVQLGTVRAVVLEGHATAPVCLCPGAATPSISRLQALRARGGGKGFESSFPPTVCMTSLL